MKTEGSAYKAYKNKNNKPGSKDQVFVFYILFKRNLKRMTLKEAKVLFDEIVDLCYQLENHNLNGALDSFYQEVSQAQNEYDVLDITSELMFYVDEINCYDNDIEDIKAEIQDLYNKMQDEIE